MAGGKSDETSSNKINFENDDKGIQSNFDDARNVSNSTNPIIKSGQNTSLMTKYIPSDKIPP